MASGSKLSAIQAAASLVREEGMRRWESDLFLNDWEVCSDRAYDAQIVSWLDTSLEQADPANCFDVRHPFLAIFGPRHC